MTAFVAYVQPFGWGSREFLRKLVLGQQVAFKVDYRVESISRDFGTITLNGESVSRAVVREGWARVKTGGQNREGETSPEYDELVKLEAEAQGAKRGMHSDDRTGAVRDAKVSNETCITRFLVLRPQRLFWNGLKGRYPISACCVWRIVEGPLPSCTKLVKSISCQGQWEALGVSTPY
jgi:hypothetical protein